MDEEESVHELNKSLKRVDQHAGGDKNMEVDVYMGAFNWLSTSELLEKFNSIEWKWPGHVQLMICEQDDDSFTVYKPMKP